MKPTQEELQLKSGDELDEISALVCMSLHQSTDINGQPAYVDANDRLFNDNGIWQPTQNTPEGKGQCWNLMVTYGLAPRPSGGGWLIFVDKNSRVTDKDPQRCVVIAAILSLQ